jgi:hypothetical protein
LEERVFSEPRVKRVLKRFVCVRLDGRESTENRALKLEYGPVVMGNVQNRIVSPSGENLAPLPTSFDIPELVNYLERWLGLYPGHEEPAAAERPLPYFATLHQGLNVAACDARVLVVVLDPDLEPMLRPLAWDREFAGRLHFVPAHADDGALRRVDGIATAAEGAYLVMPDEFGMKGEVSAQLAVDMSPGRVVEAARVALRSHAARFQPRTLADKFQRHIELGAPDWFYMTDRQAT